MKDWAIVISMIAGVSTIVYNIIRTRNEINGKK